MITGVGALRHRFSGAGASRRRRGGTSSGDKNDRRDLRDRRNITIRGNRMRLSPPGTATILGVIAARVVGRPVKLVLRREQMYRRPGADAADLAASDRR